MIANERESTIVVSAMVIGDGDIEGEIVEEVINSRGGRAGIDNDDRIAETREEGRSTEDLR